MVPLSILLCCAQLPLSAVIRSRASELQIAGSTAYTKTLSSYIRCIAAFVTTDECLSICVKCAAVMTDRIVKKECLITGRVVDEN